MAKDFFYDFETTVRDELPEVARESIRARLEASGIEMNPDGAFEASMSQAMQLFTAVSMDATMHALRRYHEWTESAPR